MNDRGTTFAEFLKELAILQARLQGVRLGGK
jgi:hypothetical protein